MANFGGSEDRNNEGGGRLPPAHYGGAGLGMSNNERMSMLWP